MRNVTFHILLLGTLPLIGCASGNVDLLEARLRTKDSELRALNNRLETTERQLASSRREMSKLQQQLANSSTTPEEVSRLAQIEGIVINPRLTGALNEDGKPGDDVLNVLISPVDSAGEVVKLNGRVEVEAIDPSLPEDSRKLGAWTIALEDSADQWHDGFLGQGFQLTTPWQRAPQSEEIVLMARYTTPDGRQFSTTQGIAVTPSKNGKQPPGLLPLPAANNEPEKSAATIRPIEFQQTADASKPFPMNAPKITPAPRTESFNEPKPLPEDSSSQPIPLNELLDPPTERDTPPFVE